MESETLKHISPAGVAANTATMRERVSAPVVDSVRSHAAEDIAGQKHIDHGTFHSLPRVSFPHPE